MFKSGFIKLNKNTQSEEKKPKPSDDRGVVYLGHIPHGFYENEMKQYFSQFGEITNINIPKSKRTGRAQGYAFIEFMYPEVAKVVAETMNNYLMHKKILVAKYLPPNQVKNNTFWRSGKNRIPLTIKNRSIQRKAMECPLDSTKEKGCKVSREKRMKAFQKKLKSKGIEYDIQTYNPEKMSKNNISNETDSLESCASMELNDSEDKITHNALPSITKKKKTKKVKDGKLRIKS